jgi:hypothetical protein
MSILQILNSDIAVRTSGFMVGFMYEFKFKRQTLDAPLSAILNASVSGFFTFLGAIIVSIFVPIPIRFIIPVTSTLACVYYKWKDLHDEE